MAMLLRCKIICLVFRRRQATPEDCEFFDCQQEMLEELDVQYCQVERIVSK